MNEITDSIRINQNDKEWYLVDATDKVLGRLCSNIAKILRGKHKPTFTPNSDNGDFVVVINASKIKLTGKKADTKTYKHYTGYPSGLRINKFKSVINTYPDRVIKNAVKGMLPHTKLGNAMLSKLKVYADSKHPHASQNPKTIDIIKE